MKALRIHLFKVAPDEAEASINAHGYLEMCTQKGCDRRAVAMAMLRRDPGIGWGSINALGLCERHEDELLKMSIKCGETTTEE